VAVSRRFLRIRRLKADPLSSSPNLRRPDVRKQWSNERRGFSPPLPSSGLAGALKKDGARPPGRVILLVTTQQVLAPCHHPFKLKL